MFPERYSNMWTTQNAISTPKAVENKINLDYSSSKLSWKIKYMHRESTWHKFMFVEIDKVTDYWVTIPSYIGTSHDIGETLINHVFC